jgi:hypothetical protein
MQRELTDQEMEEEEIYRIQLLRRHGFCEMEDDKKKAAEKEGQKETKSLF